jgi:phage terminase small subunit
MPVLENARHERFAQALAKGETADAAYVIAGYEENRGNATRLKANESVEARVAEILERAAMRAEITVAGISERLLMIAEKGEKLAEASGLSVARASLMDVAKLNGLVVDKREMFGKGGGPIEYTNMTEAEIDARLAALAGVSEPAPAAPED